jgi:Protein of unknown function (DUF3105)
VSSRKERKEALRRERLERERQAQEAARRKRMVGYGVGGALVVAVVAVLGVAVLAGGGGGDGSKASADVLPSGGSVPPQRVNDLAKAAKAANCTMRRFKATSRAHTTDVRQRVKYGSNPPTSGEHYQFPADDGAYSKAPPDVTLVHAQEHGRVILWFRPSLPKETRADLKALFDKEQGYQMLLVPRQNMPYHVAESAWGRDPIPNGTGYLMGCSSVSDATFDALRAFIDEHRGNGPEPVP